MSHHDPIEVLVVDDHDGFRAAASMVIDATEGFVLAGTAASGEDALAFLADHDVALVLVDLHLGGADGVTTARLYGEAGGQGVVVLMSTTAVEDLPPGIEQSGISAFIAKDDFSTVALGELWHDAGHEARGGAADEGNGAGTDRGRGQQPGAVTRFRCGP